MTGDCFAQKVAGKLMTGNDISEIAAFLAPFMPSLKLKCEGDCNKEVELAKAVHMDSKTYCSDRCADISNAPMVKPQPKATVIDGWDV